MSKLLRKLEILQSQTSVTLNGMPAVLIRSVWAGADKKGKRLGKLEFWPPIDAGLFFQHGVLDCFS